MNARIKIRIGMLFSIALYALIIPGIIMGNMGLQDNPAIVQFLVLGWQLLLILSYLISIPYLLLFKKIGRILMLFSALLLSIPYSIISVHSILVIIHNPPIISGWFFMMLYPFLLLIPGFLPIFILTRKSVKEQFK